MFDDDHPTATTKQQEELEQKVLSFYSGLAHHDPDEIGSTLRLHRENHATYLHGCLGRLGPGFASLDASRPWICYWVVHSLALLGAPLPDTLPAAAVVRFLARCQSPDGGYGGGPMQLAHLAPTYAAVATLVSLGDQPALDSINRAAMRAFLLRMCIPAAGGGGFSIHEGGEADLRACYTAMAVAHMLGLDRDELLEKSNMVQFVARCQTYEGGLGGEPGNEAHGGYTFCGLAALVLAGRPDAVDLPRLLRWAVARQGCAEGGFNGRTNKLVDGCYSFWQGGVFPLLQSLDPALLCSVRKGASSTPATGHFGGGAFGSLHGGVLRAQRLPLSIPEARTPAEVAESDMDVKQVWSEGVIAEAVNLSEAVDAALKTGSVRRTSAQSAVAREHMDRANKAQEVVERATLAFELASCSASALLPTLPAGLGLHDPHAFYTTAGDLGADGGDDQDDPARDGDPVRPVAPTNALLYNHKALQLWLLKCCQAPRGGLRDKPGKPVDAYHTCYCLSGLSSSQHSSGYVLGSRSNLLHAADPACNVCVTHLAAARAHFAAQAPLS